MKARFSLFALVLMSATFAAHASCDDVKSSIDAKIKANNVSNYTLDVVAKDQAGDGKVVGQCDGGSKPVAGVANPFRIVSTTALRSTACAMA